MKNRRIAPFFVTVVASFALAGCAGRGMIHVSEVGPLIGNVADRHDAYVTEDEDLSTVERRVALRSSEILRRVVEEATPPPGE